MSDAPHSLLARQLKRFFGERAGVPESLQPFIEAVNKAYHQADADRLMLERSLELSSEELTELNGNLHKAVQDLRRAHDELEQRVSDRTRELQAATERLRHAHRLEAIGQLAGGVAHDFNNHLTVILGCSELMTASPLSQADRDELAEIRRAAQRAAQLTQQLLAFSRRQVLTPKVVDLNEVVTGLQSMLTRLIREDIALRFTASPSPATVNIDPSQLEQVILNLVLNARDALPGGGHIDLQVTRLRPSATEIHEHDLKGPGDYVRLTVADNGIGMPPEVRARVFEPFFTTKETGKGTGLGLASVYGIVRQSNGIITVESQPGVGTTFRLYFPLHGRETNADAPAGGSTDPVRGRQRHTVLLVEDEHAVRRTLSRLLAGQGYVVLEAGTPEEACDIFAQRHAEIDLLVTDIVMPGMNGPTLARQLMQSRPALPVLFISGYSDLPASEIDLGGGQTAFLNKPIQSSTLLNKIGELLADHAAAARQRS